jgi:hypothetical protein
LRKHGEAQTRPVNYRLFDNAVDAQFRHRV